MPTVISKYTRDVFLKMMITDPRNKVCFDCNMRKSTYGTLPLAVFICDECARTLTDGQLGPFVKPLSVNWSSTLLLLMTLGGNSRALKFFNKHNWIEDGKLDIHAKHTSTLAEQYEIILVRDLRSTCRVQGYHNFKTRNSDPECENFLNEGCEEIVLARKKFSHAKSISSSQFFEDPLLMNDTEAKFSLAKFSGSSAISSNDLFGCSANTNSAKGFLKAVFSQIFVG